MREQILYSFLASLIGGAVGGIVVARNSSTQNLSAVVADGLRQPAATVNSPLPMSNGGEGPIAKGIREACEPEVESFCAKVVPGKHVLYNCLLGHKSELRSSCYEHLQGIHFPDENLK